MDIKNNPYLKSFFEAQSYNGVKAAVHCNNINDAHKICELFDKYGERWGGSGRYTEKDNYEFYKEETCYLNNNCYGSKGHCESTGIKVISAETFLRGVSISDLLTQYDTILDLSESAEKLYNMIEQLNLWSYLQCKKTYYHTCINNIKRCPFYVQNQGLFVTSLWLANNDISSYKIIKVK